MLTNEIPKYDYDFTYDFEKYNYYCWNCGHKLDPNKLMDVCEETDKRIALKVIECACGFSSCVELYSNIPDSAWGTKWRAIEKPKEEQNCFTLKLDMKPKDIKRTIKAYFNEKYGRSKRNK